MNKEQVMKMLSDTFERLQGLVVQPTMTNISILHTSLAEIQVTHRWLAELDLPKHEPGAPEQEEPKDEQGTQEQEEQNDDGREI